MAVHTCPAAVPKVPCQTAVLSLFLTLTLLCTSVHAAPRGLGSYDLYGPEDKVILLNSTTIAASVFNSNHAWLVEFFAHWCGHCIRFAPVYKQFADEVYDWHNIVTIAALNCADEVNTDACSEFGIEGYPTLRFFPPHYPQLNSSGTLNKGTDIQKGGGGSFISGLKKQLVDHLEPHYPLLLSYSNYTDNGISDLPELSPNDNQTDAIVIIFENSTSYLGREVALSFSFHKNIKVYRFGQPNDIYETHKQLSNRTMWPAVLYVGRDGASRPVLINKEKPVESVCQAVLKLAGMETTETTVMERPVVVRRGDAGENTTQTNNQIDSVSMDDLLHTIRDTLHTEVAIPRVINGTKLLSLQNYLEALVKFFPTDRLNVQQFLKELYGWTKTKTSIQASEFRQKLGELETMHSPWNGVDLSSWQDCKATISGRRGYTCGLWRLFHTLTVIAVQRNATEGPMAAVHGYVKDFFGCKECSQHFTAMVERDKVLAENSSTPEVQALWLWRAHNEVNLRTKGAPSEDPGYPKQSYPSRLLCPRCFDINGNYIAEQVLRYLKKIYTKPVAAKKAEDEAEQIREERSTLGSKFRDLIYSIVSFFI